MCIHVYFMLLNLIPSLTIPYILSLFVVIVKSVLQTCVVKEAALYKYFDAELGIFQQSGEGLQLAYRATTGRRF